ncbi:hypothetical protein Peur_023397 [Populus x canadensis]
MSSALRLLCNHLIAERRQSYRPKMLGYRIEELVIEDFLSKTNKPLHVSKDEFGSYAIQKALKVTKQSGSPLYQKSVSCLQPHFSFLQAGCGRNVFNLIILRNRRHIKTYCGGAIMRSPQLFTCIKSLHELTNTDQGNNMELHANVVAGSHWSTYSPSNSFL